MFDASRHGKNFPNEVPRAEPPKVPPIRLTPELRVALQKISEQLREFSHSS